MSIFLMGGLVVREIRDSKAEKAVKSLQRAVNKGNDSDSDAASGSDSDSDTSRGPKRSGAEVELLAIGRHKRPSIYEDTGNDADAAGAAPEELMQAHRELMEQQVPRCFALAATACAAEPAASDGAAWREREYSGQQGVRGPRCELPAPDKTWRLCVCLPSVAPRGVFAV